jgi:endonuclease/exonuclease/phosphatase family metal-dependent hydrolase
MLSFAVMSTSLSLRIVTFNAWALPISIPSQRKRRRLGQLPQALAALDADVIVLQEMFDVRARRRVVRELCPPYVTTLPIAGSRFVPHPAGVGWKPDERVGRKGAMIVHFETPLGQVTLFTTHLYAGTKPKDARVRCTQLAPLLEILNQEANGNPVVLAGDFNTSPTVGYPKPAGAENPLTPEYAALIDAGFKDPLPPNPTPPERTATWVPSRNRYAALPYQETRKDARYDYVLVRSGSASAWEVKNARTVIDDAGAHLSDHVGVQVELALSRQNP